MQAKASFQQFALCFWKECRMPVKNYPFSSGRPASFLDCISFQCLQKPFLVWNVPASQQLCMCLVHLAYESLLSLVRKSPWHSSFDVLLRVGFQYLQGAARCLCNETLMLVDRHCYLEDCSVMPKPYYCHVNPLFRSLYLARLLLSFFSKKSFVFDKFSAELLIVI